MASVDTSDQQRVGEVVEASTSRFVVQCHELYGAPPLGSLVRSEGGVYGVVAEVATQSLDPGRRAVAMGRGEESAEAVYRRHPQLDAGCCRRSSRPSWWPIGARAGAEPLPGAHAPAHPRDRLRVQRL